MYVIIIIIIIIIILSLATNFDLNRPSSDQYLQTKPENTGTYSTKTSILWDPIYIH